MHEIKVLHVGHSVKWRGGENQVRLLLEKMQELDCRVQHYLAYPKNAIIFNRLGNIPAGNVCLPTGKPIDPRSILMLVRFCRKHAITIIHAHSANAHTLAFIVKCFLPNIKLIVHRRVDNPIKTKKLTRIKYLSSKVDAFITVSTAIANIVQNYGVPRQKIHCIPSAIDSRLYRDLNKTHGKATLISPFGWSNDTPLIGFVAAFENQKHPELFVEIIRQLKEKNIKVNAVMAGKGRLEVDVANLITQYELGGVIKMLGPVENIQEIFSALDFFILPSRNEGLGTVLLEAIFAEAVVVASNVGGIGEVIINGETGHLVTPGKVGDYVSVIQKILGDENHREILQNQAKLHVAENFDLKKMALDTVSVYRKIVSDNDLCQEKMHI